MSAVFAQPKADGQGFVDLRHRTGIQRTHLFAQTALVDGANLLEQHDGISGKPAAFAIQLDVGGQLVLIGLAGDGRSIWVGSLALSCRLVMAAAMTVGLYRLPMSFCTISTGRTPPCSEPTTGLRSA